MIDPTLLLVAASALLSTLSCLLMGYTIYKVRQIHRTLYSTDFEVRRMSLGLTQNLQCHEHLSHEVALDRPLPLLRGWAASPDVLLLLARRIRRDKPDVIVECGSGVSTVVQARAAQLNNRGHVYAIDHDAEFAEQTRTMLAEYGLSDWATVTHAPLRLTDIAGEFVEWYSLDAIPDAPAIDQLFIDGPPADSPKPLARYPAGPVLFPKLSNTAAVFLDDAARPGELEVLHRWSREFPGLIQHPHACEKGCYELRPAAVADIAA